MVGPEYLDGYVVLCDREGGTSMTAENISDVVVIEVAPVRQQWRGFDVDPPARPQFPQQVSLSVVRPHCEGTTCTVPPGTTLRVEAGEPVRFRLTARVEQTAKAFVLSSLEDAINSRLGTPGQRLLKRAAACALESPEAFSGPTWETAFRNTLEATASCRGLLRDIEGADPAGGEAARGVLARARKFAGPALDDILVLGAKGFVH